MVKIFIFFHQKVYNIMILMIILLWIKIIILTRVMKSKHGLRIQYGYDEEIPPWFRNLFSKILKFGYYGR